MPNQLLAPEVPFRGGGRPLTREELLLRQQERPGIANRILGPHLRQGVENVGNVARGAINFLGPQADVRDMALSSRETMESLRNRDWMGAGANALYTAAAPLGLAIPGTIRGIRKGSNVVLDAATGTNATRAAPSPAAAAPSPAAAAPPPVLAPRGHNNPPQPTTIYDPPGSRPEYRGMGVNRQRVEHERYEPPRGVPQRTRNSIAAMENDTDGVYTRMMDDINNGLDLDAADWYNTEELRDWFVAELGETDGDKGWRVFLNMVGATSPGSQVLTNIRNASYYFNKGPQWILDNQAALMKGKLRPLAGYGHRYNLAQSQHVVRATRGEWDNPLLRDPTVDPKTKGFTGGLLGGIKNIAADLHFTRYFAMATESPEWLLTSKRGINEATLTFLRKKYGDAIEPFITRSPPDRAGKIHTTLAVQRSVTEGPAEIGDYLLNNQVWEDVPRTSEYKAFEDYIGTIAKRLGLAPAQVQAALWMGAAKRTGVADASQGTFMNLFRRQVQRRAKETDQTPQEVLGAFLRREKGGLLDVGVLAGAGAAVGGAGLLGAYGNQQQQVY